MTDHPQTTIEHDGFVAEVDEEIAPLLLDLWRLGCWTTNSCQDNLGKVWIEFETSEMAEAFATLAADEYSTEIESLYNRVVAGWEPEDWETFRAERMWSYDVHPEDVNVKIEQITDSETRDNVLGAPDVRFAVSVRFPRSDLPEVATRVRHAVEARETANEPGA